MTSADWRSFVDALPAEHRLVALGAAVLALGAVVPWPVWRATRNVVTIAHEGGHAAVALLAGRRLSAIRLHSDTSGLTVTRGKPRGPGMVLTSAAGYPAPSLLGLGCAALLAAEKVTVLLWAGVVLLAAMLVMIRNVFGVLSVVVTGGALFAVSWYAPSVVQTAFAYLFTWFLLFGGVRPVWELHLKRRRGRAPGSDADALAELTGLAGGAWVVLFGLLTVAAATAGALLLLR
jgi:hypothetical protein